MRRYPYRNEWGTNGDRPQARLHFCRIFATFLRDNGLDGLEGLGGFGGLECLGGLEGLGGLNAGGPRPVVAAMGGPRPVVADSARGRDALLRVRGHAGRVTLPNAR